MADPIQAAREMEQRVAANVKTWLAHREHFRMGFVTPDGPRPRREPTLHERYRSEARGESFGERLSKQAKP